MSVLAKYKHRRWRQDLSAHVDRRLTSGRKEQLERHLAACATCSEDLTSLQSVVSLFHRVPQMPAPRSFALVEAPAPRPGLLRYSPPLRYATAITAMLLLTVVVGDVLAARTTPRPGGLTAPAQIETTPSLDFKAGALPQAAAVQAPSPEGAAIRSAAPTPAALAVVGPDSAGQAEGLATAPQPAPRDERATLRDSLEIARLVLAALLAVLATVLAVQALIGRGARLPR